MATATAVVATRWMEGAGRARAVLALGGRLGGQLTGHLWVAPWLKPNQNYCDLFWRRTMVGSMPRLVTFVTYLGLLLVGTVSRQVAAVPTLVAGLPHLGQSALVRYVSHLATIVASMASGIRYKVRGRLQQAAGVRWHGMRGIVGHIECAPPTNLAKPATHEPAPVYPHFTVNLVWPATRTFCGRRHCPRHLQTLPPVLPVRAPTLFPP